MLRPPTCGDATKRTKPDSVIGQRRKPLTLAVASHRVAGLYPKCASSLSANRTFTSGKYLTLDKVFVLGLANHFFGNTAARRREERKARRRASKMKFERFFGLRLLPFTDQLGDGLAEGNAVGVGEGLGKLAGVIGNVDIGTHEIILHPFRNACKIFDLARILKMRAKRLQARGKCAIP